MRWFWGVSQPFMQASLNSGLSPAQGQRIVEFIFSLRGVESATLEDSKINIAFKSRSENLVRRVRDEIDGAYGSTRVGEKTDIARVTQITISWRNTGGLVGLFYN
jgi:hypothetical protein